VKLADRNVLFGFGLEIGTGEVNALLAHARQADRDGLDLVTMSDHPYFADRLDAYATLGVVLGATNSIAGAVNVTNLPSRPAPMLARTVTTLSALSGGRVVLGIGAGGLWQEITKLGVRPLSPAQAVRAMEEAITVIRALSGGGPPVSFDGEFYQVADLLPASAPAPPIWTGSVGPKSLAVTGRRADGWIPGHAADWRSTRFTRSRPIIDGAAVAAGRNPSEIATIFNVPGRITTSPLPATRDDSGRWIGGSAGQWATELTTAVLQYDAAGFVYFPVNDGTPSNVALGRWANEVAPAVREATIAPAVLPDGCQKGISSTATQVRARLVHELTGTLGQRAFERAVGFNDLPGDEDGLDVRRARTHDKRGDRIAESVQMRRAHVDDRHIGLLARREAADLIVQVPHTCRVERGQLQHVALVQLNRLDRLVTAHRVGVGA
jgi:alkanesulfonate monooxygenase SsuD/methylene tetrahydromethanopterin reductase-like flavin-dependent oxidoreductase (luciferase family)